MTLSRMLKEMTSREVAAWMAFLSVDEKQKKQKKEVLSSKIIAAEFKAAGLQVEAKNKQKAKRYAKRKIQS